MSYASAAFPPATTVTAPRPSQTNVYASDHWKAVRDSELQRSTALWKQAGAPIESGVVPKPAYAGMFQSLSGEWVSPEQFTHNNMQPYYRGKLKQNVDPEANSTLLESFTGRGDLLMKKQETSSFFEPTKDMGFVCGMPDNTNHYLEHIEAPRARNNDTPFEQVRVAPGLGIGYTSEGCGGFQQAATLDAIRPKTVDELRVASRPKVSLPSRPTGAPKAANTSRGMVGTLEKRRPDTFYEQNPDQWIRTTGAVIAETGRPVVNIKPTARVESHSEYLGQATAGNRRGKGEQDDFGRSGVLVPNTERQVTQTRTVVSNVTSIVKAAIAPLLDVMKRTPKEYLVDASRTFGNMSAQIPNKPTVYDPVNHMLRTTIKETTIHDAVVANPRGHNEGRATNPEAPRTTVRETMPVVETRRNISSHTYRVVVYNPDAIAKTTIKETTIASKNPAGYVGGGVEKSAGAYTHIDVQVPLTQKQFTSDTSDVGIAGSKADFRQMSDGAARAAEIDGTREMLNIAAGHTPGAGGAYTSLNPDVVADGLNTRKLVNDSVSSRAVPNGITRVVGQQVQPIDACTAITKPAASYERDAVECRLDPATLNSLDSNPYNISLRMRA